MQRSRYTHIAKQYSPTHRSLQPVASSTYTPIASVEPYLPIVENHIIIGRQPNLSGVASARSGFKLDDSYRLASALGTITNLGPLHSSRRMDD